MINYDVLLNSRGLNANLKGFITDTMESNGFRWTGNKWYLMKDLGHDISLNIAITKNSLIIDILDDSFLQLYDYQKILRNNPEQKVALEIHEKVQSIMRKLSDAGIIQGWIPNDYI